jgi:hypothetical protein
MLKKLLITIKYMCFVWNGYRDSYICGVSFADDEWKIQFTNELYVNQVYKLLY